MTLDQLIAAHDATHREFARAIARGDENGVNAANRDLINIGEQLNTAAQQTVQGIHANLAEVDQMEPALRQRTRLLEAEAAELGRLAQGHVDNSVRSAEFAHSTETSLATISTTRAAFILFITLAIAMITGWYKLVVFVGIITLLAIYKPFSGTIRW
jgi:hypothetical protein